MLSLINYTKLFLWSSLYYFQKEKSDTVFKIIVKNIKESGSVTIKFVQWLLPKIETIYDIDEKNPKHKWFYELEEVYENCDYHDIDYTRKTYQQDFNRDIDLDYEIISEIASGSIGQVYKIKSKYDNRLFAMKVIHPNVNSNLFLIEYLLKLLYNIPVIKNYCRYYFPIDVTDFIRDFRIQTDMVNEGNNILHFSEIYKDQDVYVIPNVYKFSKNVLIMSYEESTPFDKIETTSYMKYKMILLNKIFVKSNQHTHRLMHGDLHKGNWKVRINEGNNIQIVIYDYGFCWRMPTYITQEDSLFIDRAMITPIEDIEKYGKALHILINKLSPLKSIFESIDSVSEDMLKGTKKDDNDKKKLFDDPLFLVKLILEDSRKNGYLIDSFIFQSIIIHNQLCKNLIKYGINIKKGKSDYFQTQIFNIINICQTYNTCIEYSNIIKKEYDALEIKKDTIFNSTDYLKDYNLDVN